MSKLRVLILFSCIVCFVSAQTDIKPEWRDSDVSMFNHYFNNFPLDSKTTVNDLITNLERFESASKDSIGFDGILYWWILPGGTITINSYIVSYHGKIAMGETIIYKDDIKYLDGVFERDKRIEEEFFKHFKLQVNPHFFTDSVYVHSFTNDSVLNEYKTHVAAHLGKQKELNLAGCEFEYNLLNKPTGSYQFESWFRENTDYPPFYAINKLISENRIDCIKNIIRGYSLPGRMYGTAALLQLAEEGTYQLSIEDKELIKKVLSLNLEVQSGSGLTEGVKYKDCINPNLLKLIEE